MEEMRQKGYMAKGGKPYQKATGVSETPVANLESQGVDKALAKRARMREAMPSVRWLTSQRPSVAF